MAKLALDNRIDSRLSDWDAPIGTRESSFQNVDFWGCLMSCK